MENKRRKKEKINFLKCLSNKNTCFLLIYRKEYKNITNSIEKKKLNTIE